MFAVIFVFLGGAKRQESQNECGRQIHPGFSIESIGVPVAFAGISHFEHTYILKSLDCMAFKRGAI